MNWVEYRGHAGDYVRGLQLNDLLNYQAIICVSGDGLIHEIVNAMYSRGELESMPPLGCIPVGSGNAIAASLCYRSG